MKNPSVSWEKVKMDILKDDEVRKEIEDLKLEYILIKEIIKARLDQNISQKELAKKIGTKQSNISRLESGEYNPSLKFLKKVADSLGKELVITLKNKKVG
jgi:predicted transcriptional regulator